MRHGLPPAQPRKGQWRTTSWRRPRTCCGTRARARAAGSAETRRSRPRGAKPLHWSRQLRRRLPPPGAGRRSRPIPRERHRRRSTCTWHRLSRTLAATSRNGVGIVRGSSGRALPRALGWAAPSAAPSASALLELGLGQAPRRARRASRTPALPAPSRPRQFEAARTGRATTRPPFCLRWHRPGLARPRTCGRGTPPAPPCTCGGVSMSAPRLPKLAARARLPLRRLPAALLRKCD